MLRYLERRTVMPERQIFRRRCEMSESKVWTTTASEMSEENRESVQCMSCDTPRCKVCKDLELGSNYLWIEVANVVNPSPDCSACSMLSTVLQPWLKDLDARSRIHVASSDPGLSLFSNEDDVRFQIYLQSPEGYPSPWPIIPERRVTCSVTGPDLAVQAIGRWLELCDSSHPCVHDAIPGPLPKRILEIDSSRSVRLLLSSPKVTGLYACLSHRWGGTAPLQLTTLTLVNIQSEIPWHSLPLTFQHAVEVTYKLGLRYLWIDSLCILQDDDEDWREEGSKMADIYSGAWVTLAASASADSTEGLFRPDPFGLDASEHRQIHCLTGPDRLQYRILVRPSSDFSVLWKRTLPLQGRAWFFQEWQLSPRVAHFTDALLCWECNEVQQTEDGSAFNSHYFAFEGKKSTLASLAHQQPFSSSNLNLRDSRTVAWHALISMYSRMDLTIPSDVLPALQGITTRMATENQCNFFAGLWEKSLMIDLLWFLDEPSGVLEYRAPSWSWASRSRKIVWGTWRWLHPEYYPEHSTLISEAFVVSISTRLVGRSPFGQVSDGELVLKGLCLPVMFGPRRDSINRLTPRAMIDRMDESNEVPGLGFWYPDTWHDPQPDADILMMLIGLWPQNFKHFHAYESWFLVFERVCNVGDVYRRIGIYHTHKLAFRARFRRHAIEQELTII